MVAFYLKILLFPKNSNISLQNYDTIIKISKFILIKSYYLISRSYSNFTKCPTNSRYFFSPKFSPGPHIAFSFHAFCWMREIFNKILWTEKELWGREMKQANPYSVIIKFIVGTYIQAGSCGRWYVGAYSCTIHHWKRYRDLKGPKLKMESE